jgi:hypothetical protein
MGVDRQRGDVVRQAGRQRDHARGIAARAERVAGDDRIDRLCRNTGARQQRL